MVQNRLARRVTVPATSFVAVVIMLFVVSASYADTASPAAAPGHDNSDASPPYLRFQPSDVPAPPARTTTSDDDVSASEDVDCFYASNANDPACKDANRNARKPRVQHARLHRQ